MSHFEKQLSSNLKYTGKIVNVWLDTAEVENGSVVLREVVEHPGGVTILPLDDNNMVTCVRQFRYPYQRELLELPAGKLEKGEDPYECAVRELSEETGYTAGKIIYLGPIFSSPGFSTETLHVYLATDLTSGESHPDENEFLSVERLPLDKLVEMVMKNEISDGKSIIAILKTKQYLEENNV